MSKDLTGLRFARWYVESHAPNHGELEYYNCVCDCGTRREVCAKNLLSGISKSCGCYRDVVNRDRRKHDGRGTRLYSIWKDMKSRCYNQNFPRYPDYGGRGIKLCDDWKNNFVAFHDWAITNGYSDGLTIDRINNDDNYSPENCRWVPRSEQNLNKRNNRYLTCFGKTQTFSAWERETGISHNVIRRRIDKYQWPVEKALTVKPPKNGNERLITFNNQSKTMSDWAKELNIKLSTLSCRINSYGWTIEKALTTPVNNRSKTGDKHEVS